MESFYYQLLQTFLTHLTGNYLSSSILSCFFPTVTISNAVPSCWKHISGVQSKLLQSFAPLTVSSSGCSHFLAFTFSHLLFVEVRISFLLVATGALLCNNWMSSS